MPIYEYACDHCRMVYQFLIKSIVSPKTPVCPKCGAADLRRLISKCSIVTGSKSREKSGVGRAADGASDPDMPMGGGGESGAMDDPFANMSPQQQAHAEREMMRLMSEAESMDENDPRQMGHFMARMMKIVGQEDTPEMREAIRRLQAGEDPEKIEEQLGDVLGMGSGKEAGGEYGRDSNLYPE